MLIADLSIDFDFFIREEERWGFACDETEESAGSAWLDRYRAIDVYRETDIERYADVAPEGLIEALRQKGFVLEPDRKRRIGVADSHSYAHDFFARARYRPDEIINLDAHHDLFGDGPWVHCGNWPVGLLDRWPATVFMQVYPSWKDPEEDGSATRPYALATWPSLAAETEPRVRIRDVFLCRSSPWVPPHLDPRFDALVASFAELGKVHQLEALADRSAFIVAPARRKHSMA